MRFSLWSCFLKALEKYEIGEPIYRSVLISDVQKMYMDRSKYSEERFHMDGNLCFNVGSLDMYRDLLTKINVLELVTRGVYSKTQHIPKTLTSSKAHKLRIEMRYHPSWKDWFALSLEDRLKMLE